MSDHLRTLAARLPARHQQALRRRRFARQIARGTFASAEPEYDRLASWVVPGDWVLDVGANVGHYTARLSALVGIHGRVIALEPVAENVELLAANVVRLPLRNVTVLHAAASSSGALVEVAVPRYAEGPRNFYRGSVTSDGSGDPTLAIPLDCLPIPHRVAFATIDVEGHELAVLEGLQALIDRDRPVLVVEGEEPAVAAFLERSGYSWSMAHRSPNRVFEPAG